MSGPGSGVGPAVVVLDEGFDAASLHRLRERVSGCAAVAGMAEGQAADFMLAMHELAANAVLHGAGAGRLLVQAVPGGLRCQVSDAGPGPGDWPVRQGHGLWILHQVADQVAVTSGPDGFRVTAVFALDDQRAGHPSEGDAN